MRQNMMVKEPDFKSPVISALENEERIHLLRRDEVIFIIKMISDRNYNYE